MFHSLFSWALVFFFFFFIIWPKHIIFTQLAAQTNQTSYWKPQRQRRHKTIWNIFLLLKTGKLLQKLFYHSIFVATGTTNNLQRTLCDAFNLMHCVCDVKDARLVRIVENLRATKPPTPQRRESTYKFDSDSGKYSDSVCFSTDITSKKTSDRRHVLYREEFSSMPGRFSEYLIKSEMVLTDVSGEVILRTSHITLIKGCIGTQNQSIDETYSALFFYTWVHTFSHRVVLLSSWSVGLVIPYCSIMNVVLTCILTSLLTKYIVIHNYI